MDGTGIRFPGRAALAFPTAAGATRSATRSAAPAALLAALLAAGTLAPAAAAQLPALPPGVGVEARVDSDPPGLNSSLRPQVVTTDDVLDTDRVHVAWLDYRDPTWAVYVRTLTDFGSTPLGPETRLSGTGNAAPPQLATDGADALYALWHEFEGDFERVVFARSVDDGATWSSPVPLSSISGYVGEPQLAADAQGRVYVAWVQFDGPQDQVYLRVSQDHGATWTGALHVNSTAIGHSESPRLAHDGNGTVWVGYLDRRLGDHDVFVRRWAPGAGFGPDVHVDNSPDTATSLAIAADPSGHSGLVLVAWIDLDTDGPIGLETCLTSNWSLNGGLDWQPTDTALSAVCAEPNVSPLFLDVDLAVGHDPDTGITRIHAAYGRIDVPDPGEPTPTQVFENTFTSAGLASGWGLETKLSVGGAPYPAKGPVFALPRCAIAVSPDDPSRVFVAWMQVEEGWEEYFDVQATWSSTFGASFLPAQSVTGKPDGPGSSRSAHPQLAASGTAAAIVWDDRRAWTRPEFLPPGDPYSNGSSPPLGAPDTYLNTLTAQP